MHMYALIVQFRCETKERNGKTDWMQIRSRHGAGLISRAAAVDVYPLGLEIAMVKVNQLRLVPGVDHRDPNSYVLQDQPGVLFRLALRRHTAIFTQNMTGDLTPPQFSVIAKLLEVGPTTQNYLGRLVAFDQATIKGIVDRLESRGVVALCPDPSDKRRRAVTLTSKGEALAKAATKKAKAITKKTMAPLSASEQQTLILLLKKLI
jgi:MarR family transcriptional regulator, lower aerobic nicotinate degradation pathway regulator